MKGPPAQALAEAQTEEMSLLERTLSGTAPGSSPAAVADLLLLKKRKLEDALSVIKASSEDLADKRRAFEEPLQQIRENLEALPAFVFICNI